MWWGGVNQETRRARICLCASEFLVILWHLSTRRYYLKTLQRMWKMFTVKAMPWSRGHNQATMRTLHTRLIHGNWSVWLLLLILTNSILCAQTHLLLSAKLSEGWNQALTFISHNIHPEHSRVSWRRALAEKKCLWRRSYFTNRKNLFREKWRVSKNIGQIASLQRKWWFLVNTRIQHRIHRKAKWETEAGLELNHRKGRAFVSPPKKCHSRAERPASCLCYVT